MNALIQEIPEEFVENVWMEIGSLEGKSNADKLSKSFLKKQENLTTYILSMSEDLSEDAQGLAFYLGIVIWSCYEKYFRGNLKKIDDKVILKTHEKIETELDNLDKANLQFLERRIKNNADYPQTYVLKYIVKALFENDDPAVHLSHDERGMLFIILSTHMKCLDQAVQAKAGTK